MDTKINAANAKRKRACERLAARDGTRILFGQLWPSGVKKVDTAIDQRAKDIALSTALRKWSDHAPAGSQKVRNRDAAEIREHRESMAKIRFVARPGSVTLVYSAHDKMLNDGVAVRGFFWDRGRRESPRQPRRNSN